MTGNKDLVMYNVEKDPEKRGVYAVRIPILGGAFYEDEFLVWIDGRWSYPGSDQNYRGNVHGWIGPLQRKMDR